MCRNMLCCESTTDDGLSQNGIGRRDACGNGEACKELEVRDEGPHQQRCDEPSPLMKDKVPISKPKNRDNFRRSLPP